MSEWAIIEATRVSLTFVILKAKKMKILWSILRSNQKIIFAQIWFKIKKSSIQIQIKNQKIKFAYTSKTCPCDTRSSTSANARKCSGECGRAACIHGRPNKDRITFSKATMSKSKCVDVPFLSLKNDEIFTYFNSIKTKKIPYLFCWLLTMAEVIFWSMKNKKDKLNPSPMLAKIALTESFQIGAIVPITVSGSHWNFSTKMGKSF